MKPISESDAPLIKVHPLQLGLPDLSPDPSFYLLFELKPAFGFVKNMSPLSFFFAPRPEGAILDEGTKFVQRDLKGMLQPQDAP